MIFQRLFCWAGLVLFVPWASAGAERLVLDVDLSASRVRPEGRAQFIGAQDSRPLRFDVQSPASGADVSLVFGRPVLLAGKDRLVLEGRGEESTGLAVHISRLVLLDANGRAAAVHEEDFMFGPEWNRRTLLFADFDQRPPETIRGVVIYLWQPGEIGQRYTLYLRRCQFLSPAEVAAELRPPAKSVRRWLVPRASAVAPEDRRWTNLGPGGGGWYRTVAISPHDGTCLVGGDVGGVYRSSDGCQSWRIVNTGISNTYINTFAFNPCDPNVVFAGSNGGVLKSTDGAMTWQIRRAGFGPVATFGLSASISAIAIDPTCPSVVYAGVGHEREYGQLRADTYGGRVYKSTDGGDAWKPVDLPGGEPARRLSVFSIVFDPRDSKHLVASTQDGLFQSHDAGQSWQRLGRGLDGYLTTLLVPKADGPDTMLLAYCRGPVRRGGVLKSTDGGQSWQPANQGLPASEEAWRIVADAQDPNTYYVGWHRHSGLFVTRDGGATWRPVNLSGNIHSAWFFVGHNVTGIAVDPRHPARLVYSNDMDLYQTPMEARPGTKSPPTGFAQPRPTIRPSGKDADARSSAWAGRRHWPSIPPIPAHSISVIWTPTAGRATTAAGPATG